MNELILAIVYRAHTPAVSVSISVASGSKNLHELANIRTQSEAQPSITNISHSTPA